MEQVPFHHNLQNENFLDFQSLFQPFPLWAIKKNLTISKKFFARVDYRLKSKTFKREKSKKQDIRKGNELS